MPNDNSGGIVRALATTTVTVTTGTLPVVFAAGDLTKIGIDATAQAVAKAGAVWGPGAVLPSGTVAGLEIRGSTNVWDPALGASPARAHAIEVGEMQNQGGGVHRAAVYIGGNFSATEKQRLAAFQFQVDSAGTVASAGVYTGWDANIDPAAATTAVRAIAVKDTTDGSVVYFGGDFTRVRDAMPDASDRRGLAAVAGIPDSSLAATGCAAPNPCPATLQSWNPAGSEPDAPLVRTRSLALAGGDTVAIGGDFERIGSAARNGLGAVAVGGTGSVLPWNPQVAGGPVNAVAAAPGGNVYAGGAFSSIGAKQRSNIAAIDSAGNVTGLFDQGTTCDNAVHPCFTGEVSALTLSSDASRLFVGGGFTHFQGAQRIHLAAANAQTGDVVSGWEPNPDFYDTGGNARGKGWVMALEGAGNTLYAGGAFNRIGGVARSRIGAIDMTSGEVLDWRPDAACTQQWCDPPAIHAIEASCGAVYAGGSFSAIGGQPRERLAALEPVGVPGAGQATSWDPDPNSIVYDLAREGSTVYAGGGFGLIGGAIRDNVAALDAGTGEAIEGWNPSVTGESVRAIDLSQDGSTLYAGGIFHELGGEDRAGLGAVQAVGVADGSGDALAWNPTPRAELDGASIEFTGVPATYALDAVGDSVYVGGKFAEMGSRTQSGFSAFTSGPEPAGAEPEVCAHEVKAAAPAAPAAAPPIEVPRLFDVKLTRKLELLYRLSMPATVEIDLERKVNGYELPVAKRGIQSARGSAADEGSEDGKRPTVCTPPTDRNRRAATRIARKDLGAKLKRLSPKKREALIRKRLRKMRCTMFKNVEELSDKGEQGANEVSLQPTDKKGKPKDLPRARYRVTLLPLTEASGPGAPADLDFRVLRSGEAETEATQQDDGEQGKEGTSR
jgi:hypothetical protein